MTQRQMLTFVDLFREGRDFPGVSNSPLGSVGLSGPERALPVALAPTLPKGG